MVVYTAVFGGYDLVEPPSCESDAKFVCITDQPGTIKGWETMVLPPVPNDPRRASRRCKILSHEYLPVEEYGDIVIWHGGNVSLTSNPYDMVDSYLQDCNLAVVGHPRKCIYDEIRACRRMRKDKVNLFDAQEDYYYHQGYPEGNNVYGAFLILRRRTATIIELEKLWWEQLKMFSCRDQISLPYVLWLLNIKPRILPGSHRGGPNYSRRGHRRA